MQRIKLTNDWISWFNEKLELEPVYKTLSEFRSGAAICQVFCMLHPDATKLWRINFEAKAPYQYVQNWKLLQQMFISLGINREFDIESLVAETNKKRDMLNFLQWCRLYYDKHKPAGTSGRSGAAVDRLRARSKRRKNLSSQLNKTYSGTDSQSESDSGLSSHGSSCGSRSSTQTHPYPNHSFFWRRRQNVDLGAINPQIQKNAHQGAVNSPNASFGHSNSSDGACSLAASIMATANTRGSFRVSQGGRHNSLAVPSQGYGLWQLCNWPVDVEFDSLLGGGPV